MSSTYRGVLYYENGSMKITKPYDNQRAAFDELLACMAVKSIHDRTVRTTVIKRDAKAGEFIFGTPKSLDARGCFDEMLRKGIANFERE